MWEVYKTAVIFELKKCYFLLNGTEYHQKLIVTIIRVLVWHLHHDESPSPRPKTGVRQKTILFRFLCRIFHLNFSALRKTNWPGKLWILDKKYYPQYLTMKWRRILIWVFLEVIQNLDYPYCAMNYEWE